MGDFNCTCLRWSRREMTTTTTENENDLNTFNRKVILKITGSIYRQPRSLAEDRILKYDWFGLIKCLILPPQNFMILVPPFKFNSKLFFPLCRLCVEESTTDKKSKIVCENLSQHECRHGNNHLERAFWGTFVTVELKLALLNGYRISYVVEVWTWNRENEVATSSKNILTFFEN